MKIYPGEFEELVLLTIATLGDEAYGVAIQQDIETRCNRTISIGALHSTITQLEEKGFLKIMARWPWHLIFARPCHYCFTDTPDCFRKPG